MMWPAQFAGVLVLDVGRLLQGVVGATHAALRRRGFSFWNSHSVLGSKAPCATTLLRWRRGLEGMRVRLARVPSNKLRGCCHMPAVADPWRKPSQDLGVPNAPALTPDAGCDNGGRCGARLIDAGEPAQSGSGAAC